MHNLTVRFLAWLARRSAARRSPRVLVVGERLRLPFVFVWVFLYGLVSLFGFRGTIELFKKLSAKERQNAKRRRKENSQVPGV